jgi:8-oxo-dGTP pyrophosphatase MutT (NUDIX family)
MVSPRVWVRSTPCPTAHSVFDALIQAATIKITRGTAAAASSNHRDHYDRTLVALVEEPMGVVSLDAAHATFAGNKKEAFLLPLGRARAAAEFDSTPCPTTLVDHSSMTTSSSKQGALLVLHRHPFVRLAVVGLVFDPTTQQLLLTRRPDYMRSFPGAWVLPGGTVDPNESLVEAVRREVYEETGLATSTDNKHWKLESLWESVYPSTTLNNKKENAVLPPPTAIQTHHLVVYLSTTLSKDQSSHLNLCAEEVDGAVWLSKENVGAIVNHTKKGGQAYNETEPLVLHTSGSKQGGTPMSDEPLCHDVPLGHLMGIYPQTMAVAVGANMNEEEEEEEGDSSTFLAGMAQGSLFALEEFYHSTENKAFR